MKGWRLDLRLAWERLRRDPWTTLALVIVLGLGTGVGGALVGWLQPLLYSPLPYAQGERLVYVWQTERGADATLAPTSMPDLEDWIADARTLESFAGYLRQQLAVENSQGGRERRSALAITAGLPTLLGLQPHRGRFLSATEDAVEAPASVVLGYDYWQSRFAGSEAVIGEEISLEGEPHRVVGVMPEQRGWGLDADLWISLYRSQSAFAAERGVHNTTALARLAPGQNLAAAQAEMQAIALRLIEKYPESNEGRQARVVPMHDHLVAGWRDSSNLAGGLVALLLLTVALNLILLLGARHATRRGSLSVQAALGAAPGRLFRQLLLEHALLAAGGMLLALLLAQAALAWARVNLPLGNFDASQIALQPAVIGAMALLNLGLALLIGSWPARRASRTLALGALDADGRSAIGGVDRARLARRLQMVQVSMGLLAVSVAVLLASSAAKVAKVDPGFRADGVVQMQVELPGARYPFPGVENYPNWPAVQQLQTRALAELAQVPGVESLALAQNQPLQSGWTTTVTPQYMLEGEQPEDETTLRAISPGYLQTVGVPLLAGRDLSVADRADAPPVALVNQAFVRRWYPDADPLGKKVQFFGQLREIVGVVGDVRFAGLAEDLQPAIYPPLAQAPFSGFSVLARTSAEPAQVLPPLREALWRIESEATIFNSGPLQQSLAKAMAPWRLGAGLALGLAAVVGVLMLTGLFALMAGEVSARNREIAVRRALGAQNQDVGSWLIARLAWVLLPGIALGLFLAWLAAPLLGSVIYGISPHDPLSFVLAAVLVVAIATLAAMVPLRRALAVAPMGVLRG